MDDEAIYTQQLRLNTLNVKYENCSYWLMLISNVKVDISFKVICFQNKYSHFTSFDLLLAFLLSYFPNKETHKSSTRIHF